MAASSNARAQVDKFIRDAASQNLSRLTASYIAESISADPAEVRERLVHLRDDGQVLQMYEVECPNPDCARTIQTFGKLEELPFGQPFHCENCDTEFILAPGHVWVTFTPNRDFFRVETLEEKKTA